MKILLFCNKNFQNIEKNILKGKFEKKTIFNFLNSNDVYNFKISKVFGNSLINSINLIDGFMISLILSVKNFKHMNRLSGPLFTELFFKNEKLSKDKNHFFIGLESKDLLILSKKYPYLERKNIFGYNPSYIKENKFSSKEIKKMSKLINKRETDYLWVCIGSPKQNILMKDLQSKCKFNYAFNVGAALDFLLGKKKRSPKIWQNLGLEWFYRLITDFKYSKKKVWRSLLGSFYAIKIVELKNGEKNIIS